MCEIEFCRLNHVTSFNLKREGNYNLYVIVIIFTTNKSRINAQGGI